jgi:glucose-6-phosphate isomerase
VKAVTTRVATAAKAQLRVVGKIMVVAVCASGPTLSYMFARGSKNGVASGPMKPLSLDFTGLMDAAVGDAGVLESELDEYSARAVQALEQTLALRDNGTVGFFDLPDQRDSARAAMEFARELPAEIDTMVVLGIGGSSLGPQALYAALAPPFDQLRSRAPGLPRRLFFPDNPDPATFAALLDLVDLRRTVWNVITKSGGTAETAAQLMVVAERVGAEHLVVTTDPEAGPLRRVATELGIKSFSIPPPVGGRFSVLSPVGLVPAAAAGLDVMGLLDGARAMRDRVVVPRLRDNPALLLATLLYLHSQKGRSIVVVMPYVDALGPLGDWFRQLWAESLGKLGKGTTPVLSRGATDQHSQLQLYADGPDDKVFLFVTAAERGIEVRIPDGKLAHVPEYSYLAGRGLGELLDAELRGTQASLRRRGRPSATLSLARPDAAAVGAFIMLLEAATAFAGPLFGVNPYDQPGVEEAKRLAYAALGRSGYESEAQELENAPGADPRYVL